MEISRQRDVFVFLGPPGAGKGSLSQLCVQKLGWTQLSAGDLCRKHIAAATPIGKNIERAINEGRLAPDELVCELVADWLTMQGSHSQTVILDGFPRTIAQAELLDNLITKESTNKFFLHVVRFLISDEQVLERILARFICKKTDCQAIYSSQSLELNSKDGSTCDRCGESLVRRLDDSSQAIKERLRVYHKYEQDLVNFYLGSGRFVHEIGVEQPLVSVFDNFLYDVVEKKRSL